MNKRSANEIKREIKIIFPTILSIIISLSCLYLSGELEFSINHFVIIFISLLTSLIFSPKKDGILFIDNHDPERTKWLFQLTNSELSEISKHDSITLIVDPDAKLTDMNN